MNRRLIMPITAGIAAMIFIGSLFLASLSAQQPKPTPTLPAPTITNTVDDSAPRVRLLTQVSPAETTATPVPQDSATPRPKSWYRPSSQLNPITSYPTLFATEPSVLVEALPTTIGTPEQVQSAYGLKLNDEAQALNVLKQAVDYAASVNVKDANGLRPAYQSAQAAIRLAAIDYLSRFPGSPNATPVRWRQTLADAIMGSRASDEWMLAQITDGLNHGTIDPAKINAALAPYGFTVTTQIPQVGPEFFCDMTSGKEIISANLFGDGSPSQIIWIRNNEGGTGLIAALRQTPDGIFSTYPIDSQWNINGLCQFADVKDLTGDGQPEVLIEYTFSILTGNKDGGAKIGEIYQWRKDHFAEITSNTLGSISIADLHIRYENGGKTIKQDSLNGTQTLEWNGRVYVNTSRVVPGLFAPDSTGGFNQISQALINGQSQEVSDKIAALSPSDLSAITEKYGPAAADYMAFQHGLAEALQYHRDPAVAAMQSMIDKPAAPQFTALYKAAKAFLSAYTNDNALYPACVAANGAFSEVLRPYRDAQGKISTEKAADYLGYYASDPDAPLCPPQAAFNVIASRLAPGVTQRTPITPRASSTATPNLYVYTSPTPTPGFYNPDATRTPTSTPRPTSTTAPTHTPTRQPTVRPVMPSEGLASAGVQLSASLPLDAKGINPGDDGVTDYLVTINGQPGGWLLTSNFRGYQADYLDLPSTVIGTLKVQAVPLPGANLNAFVVRGAVPGSGSQYLRVVVIYPGGPRAGVSTLLSVDTLANIDVRTETDTESDILEIEVTSASSQYNSNATFRSPRLYRWERKGEYFAQVDPLEEMTFARKLAQLQEAIRRLPNAVTAFTLQTGSAEQIAYYRLEYTRLRYLQGLAAELNGSPDSAVKAYDDIWRNYPESPFAVLAKAKVEVK